MTLPTRPAIGQSVPIANQYGKLIFLFAMELAEKVDIPDQRSYRSAEHSQQQQGTAKFTLLLQLFEREVGDNPLHHPAPSL